MRHRLLPTLVCFTGLLAGPSPALAANELSRKHGSGMSRDEHYPGVVVQYTSIEDAAGHHLRVILTHPDGPGRFPTIFLVGWLSCDSVEAPPGTRDASALVLAAMARLPGFATVRLDKAGVGDSEGDCASSDFDAELDGYRRAFRRLRDYPFVDPARIFLLGMSNGGGFAPLVAQGAAVKGYVIDGGWIKTWFEHMLEIERRRLSLSGHLGEEINGLMKSVEHLYSQYLLENTAPRSIFERQPSLKSLWEGDPDHLYGRPVAYYQQLQDLDLMAAWSKVRAPVLAIHGEFDWIMSREDYELLVALVNRNSPGTAELLALPRTGHTFEHYESLDAAFAGKASPFDEHIANQIGEWFERHRD